MCFRDATFVATLCGELRGRFLEATQNKDHVPAWSPILRPVDVVKCVTTVPSDIVVLSIQLSPAANELWVTVIIPGEFCSSESTIFSPLEANLRHCYSKSLQLRRDDLQTLFE